MFCRSYRTLLYKVKQCYCCGGEYRGKFGGLSLSLARCSSKIILEKKRRRFQRCSAECLSAEAEVGGALCQPRVREEMRAVHLAFAGRCGCWRLAWAGGDLCAGHQTPGNSSGFVCSPEQCGEWESSPRAIGVLGACTEGPSGSAVAPRGPGFQCLVQLQAAGTVSCFSVSTKGFPGS